MALVVVFQRMVNFSRYCVEASAGCHGITTEKAGRVSNTARRKTCSSWCHRPLFIKGGLVILVIAASTDAHSRSHRCDVIL